MSIFNKDFYPTPIEVIEQMLEGIDIKGKVFLEPSSGSGVIVKYLKQHHAKAVLCCESSPELAKISAGIGDLISDDFLSVKSEDISHIDYIIANPPFSADEKHILHMWGIAPDGCEIVSLCNYETYINCYSRYRHNLKNIVENNGNIINLGNIFSNADRKTNAEIGLIKLFKPKAKSDDEFEGFFDMTEDMDEGEEGILPYNEIVNIVNRYVGAVKRFNDTIDKAKEINEIIDPIKSNFNIRFGAYDIQNAYRDIDRDYFKKELQKSAWRSVFEKLNMERFVTKNVMSNLNKFVEQQENVPFTVKNVYKMLEIIVGTNKERMDKVIEEVFDKITSHYHENRRGVEGWKTNDMWMVNRKFIIPSCFRMNYSGEMELSYHSFDNNIVDDITKALCVIEGRSWDSVGNIWNFMRESQQFFGQWFEFGFLRIKGYKKGTMHAEFIDEDVWARFNITACKSKGWKLPETTEHEFRKKSKKK